MSGQNTAVSGIYRLKEQAERALNTIIAGGIRCSSISVLLLDSSDVGSAIGGTIGVLRGAGAVAVSGMRLIGAGPVMACLAMDGLARALVGIGISGRVAERCITHIANGGTLLSLSCSSAAQVLRARELLTGTGATAVSDEAGDTRVA